MVNTPEQGNIEKKQFFSEETIKSLYELGEVLRKIHSRALSEGYIFKHNKFIPPHEPTGKDN